MDIFTKTIKTALIETIKLNCVHNFSSVLAPNAVLKQIFMDFLKTFDSKMWFLLEKRDSNSSAQLKSSLITARCVECVFLVTFAATSQVATVVKLSRWKQSIWLPPGPDVFGYPHMRSQRHLHPPVKWACFWSFQLASNKSINREWPL